MISSTTSVSAPQESSHRDEILMQQCLLFSDTLKDLKSLRNQLYSAAEYFELAYCKEDQKQIVEETLKDYAIKALVNTVDHLGSVAYKVNNFLDEKMGEIRGMDLRLSCMEQVFFQVEETLNDNAHTRLKSYPTSIRGRLDFHRSKNIGINPAIAAETHVESVGDEFFVLRSPQPLPRQVPLLFTSKSMNKKPENRSTSPRRFPLLRSGSVMQRSTSPSHTNAKRRYPSEPRRTYSLCSVAEREKGKDMEQYSSKSKRLFKAMLSLRKSKKDITVYKFLDEN
ncbi:hypothetical protein COLO4_10744 [Corchorus olitorius]|uniref:Uncharacterized protein n=1 Tax=Corchorus olitorius TaxID=93759 RepID=A0A1R3K747_9ROSI|nr:hypothetical protein COLO4_10744 [Corchorus olitorius]